MADQCVQIDSLIVPRARGRGRFVRRFRLCGGCRCGRAGQPHAPGRIEQRERLRERHVHELGLVQSERLRLDGGLRPPVDQCAGRGLLSHDHQCTADGHLRGELPQVPRFLLDQTTVGEKVACDQTLDDDHPVAQACDQVEPGMHLGQVLRQRRDGLLGQTEALSVERQRAVLQRAHGLQQPEGCPRALLDDRDFGFGMLLAVPGFVIGREGSHRRGDLSGDVTHGSDELVELDQPPVGPAVSAQRFGAAVQLD